MLLVGDGSGNLAKLETTGCGITTTLEATTYFLPHGEHSILSVSEARDRRFSIVKTTKFKAQKLKLRLLI
jgi:hypothetical protein